MEGMQANLNVVWMQLREQPNIGLPSTGVIHEWATRQKGESENAQLGLDSSRVAIENEAFWLDRGLASDIDTIGPRPGVGLILPMRPR